MVTVATFTSVINQILPEPHAGLLAGILFGTKAMLSKDFLEALTITGTLHIIALSGMNISILAGLSTTTLLRFVSRRVASLITVLIIIGFVWFVGVTPSVVRAAIMGSLTLLAIVLGRQTWSLLTYCFTIAIMLCIKPDWIGELSFQLSALSTLGIILFVNKSAGVALKGRNLLQSLFEDDLRVTLSAQVFTIPLILFTFHRISLVSPLTNILIGWTIAPVTAIGMVTAIAGWIFLPLGYILGWVNWVLLEYLILVVQWTAKLPFSSVSY
ncbi:MAG: ComEC/Rec2 family competence protein [Candidatus Gottesmanbacteria bacterium]|nr:ComEC/Rec2 family competence protein [Candidatus Gottesmanbacteria bacterium]